MICHKYTSSELDSCRSCGARRGRQLKAASRSSVDLEMGELADQDEDLRLTADEKRRAVEIFRNACVKADTPELDLVAFGACIKDLMNEARERGEEPSPMPSEADLKAAFEMTDTDRGGTVDHDEFLELYAKVKAGEVNGFGGRFLSFAFSLFSSPIPVGDTRTVEADEDRRSGREDARFQSKINESQPEIGVLSQNPRLSFNRSPDQVLNQKVQKYREFQATQAAEAAKNEASAAESIRDDVKAHRELQALRAARSNARSLIKKKKSASINDGGVGGAESRPAAPKVQISTKPTAAAKEADPEEASFALPSLPLDFASSFGSAGWGAFSGRGTTL